jgi:2-polyprenyl-6-methoxyphenol hydroxylase-like FAD-dependent oxidoreductase
MIDFFGAGYDAAEAMDLLLLLEAIHHPIAHLTFRDRDGHLKASLDYATVRRYAFNGRHFNFLRGELEHVLRRRAEDDGVSPCFGTSIASMRLHERGVDVELDNGAHAAFDLVVGADGVRSRVRSLAFGPANGFARFLRCDTAAYVIDDARLAAMVSEEFAVLTEPGRQVGLYPIGEGRVATFFLYRTPSTMAQSSRDRICAELHGRYGDFGWHIPPALSACGADEEIFYDAVTQIEMPRWVERRVTLVGDACGAVSLVAGQGASLAMSGAFRLARLLGAGEDIDAALVTYERMLRPVIAHRQQAGRRLARWLLPDTGWRLALRDGVLKAAALPGVARFAARSLVA